MNQTGQRLIHQDISWRVLAFSKSEGGDRREELEQAQKTCGELVRKDPTNPDHLFMQGIIDFHLGRTKEAEVWMEKAIAAAPESPVIFYIYGIMLMIQGKQAAALLLMTHVVTLKPDHAEAHWLISNVLRKKGDLVGALAAIDQALALNPQNAEALSDKGNALKELGRLDEAALCYEAALAVKPGDYRFRNNLGVVRFLQNDLAGAEALYREVLEATPACPETLSNMSAVQRLKGDLDSAVQYAREALALRPDYPDAFNNLGNALKDGRRLEESVVAYGEVLRLHPGDADVRKNLAMALLALGRFEEGWREYEWRWKSKQLRHAARHFAKPLWRGEDGGGRTILIHAEQGLGDTLQFCRYAPLVRDRGLRVVMEVPKPLARLVKSLEGVESVVTAGETLPRFDLQCPMMNLPLALATTVETIPADLPYLHPAPADAEAWRKRIAAEGEGGLNVGLVWAGNARRHSPDLIATDGKRSMDPRLLAPIMNLPGVRFFSLQKDGPQAPEAFRLIDWMADCGDLADTAALVANLDLVVSVDTAIAHLAGALGRPVWLLNRFDSCWRWFVDREDSPWYPGTLRIFNQQTMGDWKEVILRVREALACPPKGICPHEQGREIG